MFFIVPEDIIDKNDREEAANELRKAHLITPNNTKQYQHPGVWVMFGKSVVDHNWHCINVGKNVNIGKELEYDFRRIKQAASRRPFVREKTYYNQFGEEMFTYIKFPTRTDFLYSDINKKYTDVFAMEVCKSSDYTIEKYAAYLFKASYWVSNGKNSQKIDDETVKNRLKMIKLSSEQENVISRLKLLRSSFLNYGCST